MVKFIYSKKSTKFCEIFTSKVHTVKSKVKISQNVAFSEYMNSMKRCCQLCKMYIY